MLVKDFLTYKKMHIALKEKPKEMLDEDRESLNEEVAVIIGICLSIHMASFLAKETSAVKLMKALTKLV